MNAVSITFNEQELNQLHRIADAALKAHGMQVLHDAAWLNFKIAEAHAKANAPQSNKPAEAPKNRKERRKAAKAEKAAKA